MTGAEPEDDLCTDVQIAGLLESYHLHRDLQQSLFGRVFVAEGLISHDLVAVKALSKSTILERESQRREPASSV